MADGPTPKDRFTALDTLALVREIRGLGHARVDKAYDLAGGGQALVLKIAGEGKRELRLVPGRYAAIADGAGEHTEELSPLAKDLRRLLSGAIILQANDPKSERYLELELSRGGEAGLVLALEFFGSGNLVVANAGKLVAVARPRAWAHRVVRVGAEYQRPPERTNPWAMGAAELEAELRRSRTDLISTLAARLALGGPIAEEILVRCGLPGGPPESPGDAATALYRAIASLLAEITDPPGGYVYEREGVAIDATPYRSQRWSHDPGVSEVAVPRFSAAALRYFPTLTPASAPAPASAEDKERANLGRQRERQVAAIASLEEEAQQLIGQGQAILTHFEEAARQLREARQAPEVPEEVELALGEDRVRVRAGETPRAAAQAIFGVAKRLQGKLAGARAALAATDARLAQPKSAPTGPAAATAGGPARRHSEHWFERFRWFISSDRIVVVAGRDAATNDRVVRRHLRDGDIYLHADLHGASSVVVKTPAGPGATVPERTVEEAGRWAVAYSKAWRAGLASATVFWVTSDQVSKTPATGEFVARGSWVIHGTKHFLKDLPLELALGTIQYEGAEMWTVAPESAVRALGEVRYLLTPGEERDRPEREVELARETGLSRSRLQSLLPSGGLTFRRP